MIGETGFTVLLVGFWLAEFVFAALVTYWFLTEGFAERKGETREASGGQRPLESREYTMQSLALWGGFFAVLVGLIVLGA